MRAILKELGYPVEAHREDDYLFGKSLALMEQERFAGLHLDEFQDAGRYTTGENMLVFTKRFRNMMDDAKWPMCLILSGTLEGKAFINLDPTLARRLKPIEMLPISFASDGTVLRKAAATLLGKSGIDDQNGLFNENEFVRMLIHASAYRFGIAIELTIEAIGAALMENERTIGLDHFAEAYYIKANCDDKQNPFISPNWKVIDTSRVFDPEPDADESGKKKRRKARITALTFEKSRPLGRLFCFISPSDMANLDWEFRNGERFFRTGDRFLTQQKLGLTY